MKLVRAGIKLGLGRDAINAVRVRVKARIEAEQARELFVMSQHKKAA